MWLCRGSSSCVQQGVLAAVPPFIRCAPGAIKWSLVLVCYICGRALLLSLLTVDPAAAVVLACHIKAVSLRQSPAVRQVSVFVYQMFACSVDCQTAAAAACCAAFAPVGSCQVLRWLHISVSYQA